MTNGLPANQWATPVHRTPLTSLDDKVKPQHTALLVIDVLNDFCAEGGLMSQEGLPLEEAQAAADRLPRLIEAARNAGVLVVFVRNEYNTPDNFYLSDVWLETASRRNDGHSYTVRPACPPGSWQNDFYGDVRPLPTEPIVTKHRFSAFYGTDLEIILRARGIRTLVMSGVATNVCVETTAREGFLRDYYIVFMSDGTATYSVDEHQATLRTIDRYFGHVVSIDDVVKVWPERGLCV